MTFKNKYTKPEINRITLDNSISLAMMSGPIDPPPVASGKKGNSEPFQSPFGDKPFN